MRFFYSRRDANALSSEDIKTELSHTVFIEFNATALRDNRCNTLTRATATLLRY